MSIKMRLIKSIIRSKLIQLLFSVLSGLNKSIDIYNTVLLRVVHNRIINRLMVTHTKYGQVNCLGQCYRTLGCQVKFQNSV